ncbi:MAG: hypothetical protein LUE24_11590 [Lachnospiraceae bacterium]|nr:hypothetical protein [Lachnospiraceae bacterium]
MKSYLRASEDVKNRLDEIQMRMLAAQGLLNDCMQPCFDGYTCEGKLNEMSERYNGDQGQAALAWMRANFDSLEALRNATANILDSAITIIQKLPQED